MKSFAPGRQTNFRLEIAENSTVADVLIKLKMPPETQRVVLLNGKRANDSTRLEVHATLVLFPPISCG